MDCSEGAKGRARGLGVRAGSLEVLPCVCACVCAYACRCMVRQMASPPVVEHTIAWVRVLTERPVSVNTSCNGAIGGTLSLASRTMTRRSCRLSNRALTNAYPASLRDGDGEGAWMLDAKTLGAGIVCSLGSSIGMELRYATV
jgi:hypothetical protein